MKVWFYSMREQELLDPSESYDYDSWMDSKLYSSLTACTQAAWEEKVNDAERLAERYHESLQRYEGRKAAIELLKANGIDSDELWFNLDHYPPELREPSEYYIYSLDVVE